MNTKTYLILHSALMAAMTVTAVVMCLNASAEKNLPEETTPQVETTTHIAVETEPVETEPAETEAEDIPEFDIIETEAEEPNNIPLGEFKLTAYCGCAKCCGEWADGYTATMTQATADRTIAVDPKVIPYGSEVLINGKTYIAGDCGGAIKGNRIDVYHDTHMEALEFGVQYADVTIIK